jgi:hypothetical protein
LGSEGGQPDKRSSGDPEVAFATAVIVFIAWNDAAGKPAEMVRVCPACHRISVIGHGWRTRQAHDAYHTSIRIHRGICKLCGLTLTMLPDWLVPGGHYSLPARQQAVELASEEPRPAEECIPDSADPDRSADPSTVRRWLQRRAESLFLCFVGLWTQPPTLLAWDWMAARRMLIPEISSA